MSRVHDHAARRSLPTSKAPIDRAIADKKVSRAWLRALELTSPIATAPWPVFPVVVDELAERFGDAPALLSDDENVTFRGLAQRANRYARWALAQRLQKGDTVCLLMANRPEYMAVWLGITRTGGVVALLNANLVGTSLAHCIDIAAAIADLPDNALAGDERVALNVDDQALYVYTSGTTGLPKAAKVSH